MDADPPAHESPPPDRIATTHTSHPAPAYSLKTADLDAARPKRDRIFAAINAKSGNIAA
jgi:hypothetical protein